MKRRITALSLGLPIIMLFVSGPPASGQVAGKKPAAERTFNPLALPKFADALEKRLNGQTVGYQFVVSYRDGQPIARAGGLSRRPPDGVRKMTVDERYNIASVSKTITAVAALKLLDAKKISVDEPIHPYLPPSWSPGPNVKSITFRDLLTHRSGIVCDTLESYELIGDCLEKGVSLADKQKRLYNNNNYALFRILIPRINGFNGVIPYPKGVKPPPQNLGLNYSKMYMGYVQQNVFAPAGLSGIECKPGPEPGLCYQRPGPVLEGEDFGDQTETNASRGWNMSSRQLSMFLRTLFYTDKIVPQSTVRRMRAEGLGLDTERTPGFFSIAYHGGFFPGKRADGSLWNGGELGAGIFAFSNGVNVSLIMNSQLGANLNSRDVIGEVMKEMLQ